ncbi:MAG TPA: glycosyltransferase family 2 protein [Anaeromyxobacter sp.]|nr:glycosyltransferase family 2 protein [Anaeromyxobacter sp.]
MLLPVFGVERYVADCARSLLSQSLTGVELVFLDDGSTDGSLARLEDLRAGDPGVVRVLRHDRNEGLAVARNHLLEAARGEYVWFVDPDDLVEPGAIASLRGILARHAPDLVMCDYRVLAQGGGQADRGDDHVATFRGPSGRLETDRDRLLCGLFSTGLWHPWSKVVRRHAWPASLRFPPGRLFEDVTVLPRLLLSVRSWFHAPEVWVVYRQRPGSALASLTSAQVDDWVGGLSGYLEDLRAHGVSPSSETQGAIAHYCARTLVTAERLFPFGGGTEGRSWRARCSDLWRSSCQWTPFQLERRYWLTGRLSRAFRWRRLRRQAGM